MDKRGPPYVPASWISSEMGGGRNLVKSCPRIRSPVWGVGGRGSSHNGDEEKRSEICNASSPKRKETGRE